MSEIIIFRACIVLTVSFAFLGADQKVRAEISLHGHPRIHLSEMAIHASRILTKRNEPRLFTKTIDCYGRIAYDGRQELILRAPNAGTLVTRIPSFGTQVAKDQVLITIRSTLSRANYSLRAPFSGEVIDIYPSSFQFLVESAPILRLANLEQLWVYLRIPYHSIKLIGIGQLVEGGIEKSKQRFQGKVVDISRRLDEPTQTSWARLEIENKERLWHPGQLIEATIFLSAPRKVFAIEDEAIQLIDRQHAVFVHHPPDQFELRPIEVGGKQSGLIEVTAGLSPGELYVESGSTLLMESFKIRLSLKSSSTCDSL